VVPDLVCLRGGFGERVSEDELELERGGCGDERFIAILPSIARSSCILYKRTGQHAPSGIVRRIKSNDCLCEFKNAWTLLPRFYDTTKIIGGIFVCMVQQESR
jgi:hypothetical protein